MKHTERFAAVASFHVDCPQSIGRTDNLPAGLSASSLGEDSKIPILSNSVDDSDVQVALSMLSTVVCLQSCSFLHFIGRPE